MDYTIVELPTRTIIGPTIHTGNEDPEVAQKIGELWNKFMEDGMSGSIPAPIIEPYSCYGLYYNYDFSDMTYDTMVGVESAADTTPEGLQLVVIPAGRYAKFNTRGNVVQAVIDAWNAIWAMEELVPLRANTVDFEAYHPSDDMDDTEIDLYIALK